MKTITILCVEDEPEVRESILRELRPFRDVFRVEAAEDVADAREVMEQIQGEGGRIGLILCDHRLPGESGVDFLVGLQDDPANQGIRKVLVTGQAGHQDTIRAVNQAGLDHYIAKPWGLGELAAVVKTQLTEYILAQRLDGLPYLSVLQDPRLIAVAGRHARPD